VFAQAVVLVLVGSIYPAGLVMIAIYLATERPTRMASLFLAGAATATVISGVLVLVLMRSAHLDHPDNRPTHGWVRVAAGVLFALVGLFLLRRRPVAEPAPDTDAGSLVAGARKPRKPRKPGTLARFQRSNHPVVAFAAGMVIYLPGPGYLAALDVVGSARMGATETAALLIVLTVLDLWLVWVPLATYRLAPERTGRAVRGFSGWLSRNGRALTGYVLLGLGAFLVATGIAALA